MSQFSLTVDGKTVQADRQTNLLEVLERAGSAVPDLCHYPGKPCRAVCRLCLVEVEGRPGLVTACSTPPTAGMVVNTGGEHATRVRSNLLKMILAEHGECQRTNCEVETLAQKFGVSETPFQGPSSEGLWEIESEYMSFQPDACVHCDRCLRACSERGVLQRTGRGIALCLAFDGGVSVEASTCVGCGDCLAACPTGSLRQAGPSEQL